MRKALLYNGVLRELNAKRVNYYANGLLRELNAKSINRVNYFDGVKLFLNELIFVSVQFFLKLFFAEHIRTIKSVKTEKLKFELDKFLELIPD